MNNEYKKKELKIFERAKKQGYEGECINFMMDLESAIQCHLCTLDELLDADEKTFGHDINGIIQNIDRSHFPADNFNHFLPRCSRGGRRK